jgi:hypothetical protein
VVGRNSTELRIRVLLSLQRALVGEVTPNIRAVSVEYSEEKIRIQVYIDGEISEEAKEEFDAGVVTQVVADFPYPEKDDPSVEYEFLRIDAPGRIDYRGIVIYARKGY